MENYTAGEQMLIDLGYHLKKGSFWNEFRSESNRSKRIEFNLMEETIELHPGIDQNYREARGWTAEEIQAVHQVAIDYGWVKNKNIPLQKRGSWVVNERGDSHHTYRCSTCGQEYAMLSSQVWMGFPNYCQVCGSKNSN